MASPKRLTFTKPALEALPVPESREAWYYDEKVAGLALCVTSRNARTFFWYGRSGGKPIRVRLGTLKALTVQQARDAAKVYIGGNAAGRNLHAERAARRKRPTLSALWEHWLTTHAKIHKRTWRDDQRQYEKYLTEFHDRPLDTIRTAEVAAWHGRMGQEHGPVQANRTLALLATLFNAADRVGFEGRNPCDGVKRFREESRERFLLPVEMKAFFDALAEEPDPWKDFFLLCLYTGARRGNVASMRWEDIDFESATWRISATESKNGRSIIVPLVPLAVNLLLVRRALAEGSPWVFPSPRGDGHIVEPKRAWARVLKRAGISNLRPHDLRRSLGSWAASAGTSLAIVGAALGHKTLRSTQIYGRLQNDVVRDAVTRTTQAMLEAANQIASDAPPAGNGGDGATTPDPQ